MTNKEKFDAFKREKIVENEANYGSEIREKYGEDAVEASNQKWQNMSEADYQKMQAVEAELIEKLRHYLTDETPSLAEAIYQLHKEWISFSWGKYSGEAHKGLSEMYLADERFTQYYDEKSGPGATETLVQIIQKYA